MNPQEMEIIKIIAAVTKLTVYGSPQSKEKFCVMPRLSKIPLETTRQTVITLEIKNLDL